MINLYTDISYSGLYKVLLKLLKQPSVNVFAENWIVVPNHSAKQWLQKAIAQDMGVCAQTKFIMPLSFNWEIIKNVAIQEYDINIFTKDVLRWQILDFLTQDNNYQFLKQDSILKNFHLAEKIAQTLLKYNDEHPETIAKWDDSIYQDVQHHNQWQVEMWQQLQDNLPTKSPVELLELFDAKIDFKQSPANIVLFATEQLSSLQKSTILKLSTNLDIHLFLTNPCPDDYWFDLKPAATKARNKLFNVDVADIIDVGNPLLSSLGYNKMALFDAFLQEDVDLIGLKNQCVGNNLLSSVKQDIYYLLENPDKCETDNSVKIHSCHNRKREIEVIKDEILSSLDDDTTLNPEDIIVVSTDINDYVQNIKEVFTYENSQYLPFHIDRVQLADNHYITALMQLLDSFNQEMTASIIYQILCQKSILQNFHINENDLPRIKNWILNSNIRNFYSKQQKLQLGYEARVGNTWQFGKSRWLAGYLAGEVDDNEYLSTYGDISGQEGLFSQCFEFLDLWYNYYCMAQEMKTPEKWFEFISRTCQNFLYNDLTDDYEKRILDQLENKFIKQTLNNQHEIPLVVVNSIVETVITENNYRSEGQIGIRFQSWENAFIVDAKLLIILGLNDGEFPKNQIKNDLDIFYKKPARLNKSTRQRDKNLMLTALTENTEKLIMTYVGFDAKSNESQPPSVILAELIGYLKQKTNGGFTIQEHKMHGYNKVYFNSEFNSYNLKNYQLAMNFYNQKQAKTEQNITLNKQVESQLSINNLMKFFVDPLNYFLKNHAEINHPIYEEVLQDTETYNPTGLESWKLKHEVFCRGKETAIKTGLISDNNYGKTILDKYDNSLGTLHQIADDIKLNNHMIELTLDEYKIFGNIELDKKQRLTTIYPSKASAKTICSHWIKHLCYQSNQPSFIHFEDKSFQIKPFENNTELLKQIMHKWQNSFNQPWLFCPNKIINTKVKNIGILTRKAYLLSFTQSNINFPSDGQVYFASQVEHYNEESDIENFIQPLLEVIELV